MTVSPTSIKLELEFSPTVWTDVWADTRASSDVRIRGGMMGTAPNVRVASRGVIDFALDNSTQNSGGLQGYYTPGHTNCRTGFELGIGVRWIGSYGGTDYYKFRGTLDSIKPTTGLKGKQDVVCQAVDFMAEMAREKVDLLEVKENRRSDLFFGDVISNIDATPVSTSYATGQETFVYAGDDLKDEKSTALAAAQKIALSEGGYVFVKGDTSAGGVLTFEDRHTRVKNLTSIATITETMLDRFDVDRSRKNIWNYVKTIAYPRDVGSSNENLVDYAGTPEIAGGATANIAVRFSDPSNRDQRISGKDLEDPEGLNNITNRDFETDASDWTASSGAAFAQSSSQAKLGSNSGKLTSGTGGTNTYYVESDAWSGPAQNDIIYYMVYVYAADVWPDDIRVMVSEYDSSDVIGTTTTVETVGISTASAWVRYFGTHTCVDADCAKVKLLVGTNYGGSYDFSGGAVDLYIDECALIDDAALNFEFSSSSSGGGDMNTDLELIETTMGGNSAKFVLYNTNVDTAGFMTTLKVRGTIIRIYDPAIAEAEDSTSQTTYGKSELSLPLPYQDDPLVAQDFADYLLSVYKNPWMDVKRIGFWANKSSTTMTEALSIEISDRVTLTETMAGISSTDYFVNGIELRITNKDNIHVDWIVVEAGTAQYWLIGEAGASEIGETTILGF